MALIAHPAHKPLPARENAAMGHGDSRAGQRLAAAGRLLNASAPVTAQRALAGRLSEGATARSASAPPVQAKLYDGRKLVPTEAAETASAVVRSLILAEKDYALRGDCKLEDTTVHVIDQSHKYLLGEAHGDGTWTQRTQHWDVDTMVESGKTFPEIPVHHEDEQAPRHNQPLESVYAFATAVLLQWRSAYNMWLAAWEEPKTDDVDWDEELKKLGFGTGENPTGDGDNEQKQEDDDLGELPLEEIDPVATAREMATVPLLQLKRWTGEFFKIFQLFEHLEGLSGKSEAYDTVRQHIDFGVYRKHLTTILDRALSLQTDDDEKKRKLILEKGSTLVNSVGKNLATVFNATSGTETDTAGEIKARASGITPIGTGEETALTSPAREVTMIDRVKSARAPLFVQIGTDHVGRVSDAVAGAVPVPKGTNFDTMTKATEGNIPQV